MPGQSKVSIFNSRITRDRFEFERTRVSCYGYPILEMGGFAGELPRKFLSFYCLEAEPNELRDSNAEETESYPELPQRSESEIVVIEGTETFSDKKTGSVTSHRC